MKKVIFIWNSFNLKWNCLTHVGLIHQIKNFQMYSASSVCVLTGSAWSGLQQIYTGMSCPTAEIGGMIKSYHEKLHDKQVYINLFNEFINLRFFQPAKSRFLFLKWWDGPRETSLWPCYLDRWSWPVLCVCARCTWQLMVHAVDRN